MYVVTDSCIKFDEFFGQTQNEQNTNLNRRDIQVTSVAHIWNAYLGLNRFFSKFPVNIL